MANPIKVFISYARKDEVYKNELQKWLKPYVKNQLVETWDDFNIEPGQEWDVTIRQALQDAHVLLFLVSPDFVASDYIDRVEIKSAMERYQKGIVKIVPIIIRHIDLSYSPLKKFQALPRNAKPISDFENEDSAWNQVAQSLRVLFENLQKKQKTTQQEKQTPNATSTSQQANALPDKNAIKEMLGQNKVAQALKMLSNFPGLDNDLQMQITLLSSRFNANKKNKMIGIISSEDATREDTKIVYALLSLLDEL